MSKKWLRAVRFLLVFTLLLNVLAIPSLPANAEENTGFSFDGVMYEDGTKHLISEGGTIEHGIKSLYVLVTFQSFPTQEDIQRKITLKDGTGNDVSWSVGTSYPGQQEQGNIHMSLSTWLAKSTTYTITIKGGPDGLKDSLGNGPATDIVFTFHTSDVSTMLSEQLSLGGTPPKDIVYKMEAEQGPIILESRLPELQVKLIDSVDNTIIVDTSLGQNAAREFSLPRTGVYYLFVSSPGWYDNLKVSALELNIPDPRPTHLEMRTFTPFETIDKPVYLGLNTALNNYDRVTISANGKVIFQLKGEDVVSSNPKILQLDPAQLDDGAYPLQVVGERQDQATFLNWTIYVDHKDNFWDVPRSHWSHKPVEVMNSIGILNGRENNTFQPNQPVTREEFAKMMALTVGLQPSDNAATNFVDVASTAWSKSYIDALATEGLIKGESIGGKNYFFPQRTITRAEAATIIGRYHEIDTYDITDAVKPFSDFDQIPDYAKSSVTVLYYAEWINGFEDGLFYPQNTLTRAEAAKILSKFIGL